MTKKEAVDSQPKDQSSQTIIQELQFFLFTNQTDEFQQSLTKAKKEIQDDYLLDLISIIEARWLFNHQEQDKAKEIIDKILKKLGEEKTELRARALMFRAEIGVREESQEELYLAERYFNTANNIAEPLNLLTVQGIAKMSLAATAGTRAREIETQLKQMPADPNEEKQKKEELLNQLIQQANSNLSLAETKLKAAYNQNPDDIEIVIYLAKVLINQANAISNKNQQKARQYAAEALILAENFQLAEIKAIFYHVMAWSYLDEKDIANATRFFQKEIDYIIANNLEGIHSFPDAYFDLATECKDQLEPNKIKEYLQKALQLYQQFGNSRMIESTNQELAKLDDTE